MNLRHDENARSPAVTWTNGSFRRKGGTSARGFQEAKSDGQIQRRTVTAKKSLVSRTRRVP
jgi:hypothetical protein